MVEYVSSRLRLTELTARRSFLRKGGAGEVRGLRTPALQKLARRPDETLDVDQDEPLASARRSCVGKGGAGEVRRLRAPALQKFALRPDEMLEFDQDEPFASARRSLMARTPLAEAAVIETEPYRLWRLLAADCAAFTARRWLLHGRTCPEGLSWDCHRRLPYKVIEGHA